MRNFVLLITTMLLLTSSGLKAFQNQTYNDLFTIYLGAFVQADIDDFKKLRPYGYLYAERLDGDLQQIYMGEYDSELVANKILEDVKKGGYPDSYVMKKRLKQEDELAVIQLASGGVGDDVDWSKLERAGDLFTVIYNDKIKIVTGPYASKGEAREQLKILRTMGYSDAFAKGVNRAKLHRVGAFETGESVKQIKLDEDEIVVEEYTDAGEPFEVVTEKPEEPEVIPETYSEELSVKSVETKVAVPTIRGKVKRASVVKLQNVLKGQGVYKTAVDGFYGKGTKAAYQQFKTKNRHYKKYQLLAKHSAPNIEANTSALQHYINTLLDDMPSAIQGLETSKHPMAKVYLAYALFQKNGENKETNDLMNKAIKLTFSGKQLKNKPPFDYKASYAYKDWGQLIQHLKYIQTAVPNEPEVPCWLFQRHPKEAQAAFEPFETLTTDSYKIQNCNGFMDWEELKLLSTLVNDLSNTNPNKKAVAENLSKRTRLFLAMRPLNKVVQKEFEKWDSDFWKSFDAWADKDPLHDRITDVLKVSYYQSQILLEDYFMDKGYNANQAKGLAIHALQTIVEPQLKEYYK